MFEPLAFSSLLVLAGASAHLRLELTLEEGTARKAFLLDLKPGAIRIEPEGEPLFLLFETEGPRFTLVHRQARYFVRLSPRAFRRLAARGIVRPVWIPWVYRTSPDLVDETVSRTTGLDEVEVVSKKYDRVVARYRVTRRIPQELFFQWRESYLEFYGEDDTAVDEASRKRLAVYGTLSGAPLLMEERFAALSRPRTLRVVAERPAPEGAFAWGDEIVEKSDTELERDTLLRRIEDFLGIRLPLPK